MQERLSGMLEASKSGLRLPYTHLRSRLHLVNPKQDDEDERKEGDGQELLDGLVFNDSFWKLRNELFGRSCVPRDTKSKDNLRGEFAGAIFQLLAMQELSDSLTPDVRLATDEERLDLYRHVYANPDPPKVVEHPFGEVTIEDEFYPDGVLLTKEERSIAVKAVFEATLSRDPTYIPRKYYGFRAEKKRYPGLFENAQLVFITPRHTITQELVGLASKFTDMSFVQLPFKRSQVGEFIDTVYSMRTNDDEPTILEAQAYANEYELPLNDIGRWDLRHLDMRKYVVGSRSRTQRIFDKVRPRK